MANNASKVNMTAATIAIIRLYNSETSILLSLYEPLQRDIDPNNNLLR